MSVPLNVTTAVFSRRPSTHGEGEQKGDNAAARQIFVRKRVGRREGQRQVDDGAHRHVQQGIEEAVHDQRVVEHGLIAFQREIHGNDAHLAGRNRRGRAKGTGDDVQNRHQHDEQDQEQREIDSANEQFIARAAKLPELMEFHRHSRSPFLTTGWCRRAGGPRRSRARSAQNSPRN